MQAARRVRWTEEEYLQREAKSQGKNEFFEGEIYAMAGAKGGHNVVCGNTIAALHQLVRGRPCRVFTSDQRIHVTATGLYTYADGGLCCGPWQIHTKDGMSLQNPGLLFDVLSPSTAVYDRGEKLDHYRHIPSLREILIIAHPERRVEHHHRVDGERWLMTTIHDGSIELPSLGKALLIEDLYHLSDLGEDET